MRRRAALILLAFAVFALALAPLIRWYAFPRLVVVPKDRYSEAVLEAKDATLIDYSTLKPRTEPKVTIVQTLKGNVEEAKKIEEATGRDNVVVWDALSYAEDSKGKLVSAIPERYIFDGHTQEPIHAKGEMVDGDEVQRNGIEYKWPFLTEKRDYDYFDMQTRTSAPIHYKGTQNFRGLEVYYFEQTIPWTKTPLPKKLPLGIKPETVKQFGLERWYSTKRMFWVEPVTGAPVNGEEEHKEEMRWADAPEKDPLPAFSGHVKMREDFIEHTVDLVKEQRQLVLLFHSYLPLGLLVTGAGLLGLSLLLEARSRRRPAAAEEPAAGTGDPEPVSA